MIDQVREAVARYIAGVIDADDLAAQMPDPWELDRAGADELTRRIVLRVIGYVTEFQNGDSSEPRLQNRLCSLFPSAAPTQEVHFTSREHVTSWVSATRVSYSSAASSAAQRVGREALIG